MTLLAPFDDGRDKEVQDFNYEVDALEDEHVRREVHTTKVVVDDKNNDDNKGGQQDGSYTETSGKGNKRVRKARTKAQDIVKVTPQPIQQVTTQSPQNIPKNFIKEKREAKKSFDFLNEDDKSDQANESPFASIPKFPSLMSKMRELPTTNTPVAEKKGQLLFSEIGASVKKPDEKSADSLYPFGNNSTNAAPTITAPFNNRPKPSIESLGGGYGAFDHIDDQIGFASREFMQDKSQEFKSYMNSSFKTNFNPFASGEFGRSMEPNDVSNGLHHPAPKYHK
mmetsp:Transcript_30657/g.30162  ORF Transcript_30657/g.30162 Transcript_30657/m.30162 type:complete len:281 (-) Transcript_30657:59-901(-)